ncbi:MAG: hypothetical protein K2R98_18000 [Gemmataceae bacterium]|nr:hypothetical protein [Gemmataceae bacterium]
MSLRCPVCRAELSAGPSCRRCRADLALLFAVEEQRAQLLASSRSCMARSRIDEAKALAQRADALRRDADSRQALALAHLLARDFGRALDYYRNQNPPQRGGNPGGRDHSDR